MLHDYHPYVAPKSIRGARPRCSSTTSSTSCTQPDAWRVLPADMREDIFEGILSNDIIGFHTRPYKRNFLLCCRELFDLEVTRTGASQLRRSRRWVRAYPLHLGRELPPTARSGPRSTSTSARSCAAGAST